jgi:hypothetical protein
MREFVTVRSIRCPPEERTKYIVAWKLNHVKNANLPSDLFMSRGCCGCSCSRGRRGHASIAVRVVHCRSGADHTPRGRDFAPAMMGSKTNITTTDMIDLNVACKYLRILLDLYSEDYLRYFSADLCQLPKN